MIAAPLSAFAFETERLRLRPLEAGDEALFSGLYTDPETMRFIAQPLSAQQAAKSFRGIIDSPAGRPARSVFLAILEKVTLQPLGICGVPQFDAGAIRLEVGILLRAEARSQGFAKEALTALVKRIFAVLPVDEIAVQFSAECPAVERLNISVGFVSCADVAEEEGLLPKRHWSVHRSSWRVS